jgi:hypothetical protein
MSYKLIGVALMASLALTTPVEADTNESLKVIISGGFEEVYEKCFLDLKKVQESKS